MGIQPTGGVQFTGVGGNVAVGVGEGVAVGVDVDGFGKMSTGSAVVVAEENLMVASVGSVWKSWFAPNFPSKIARDNPPSMIVLEMIAIKRPHKIVRIERILWLFFVFDAHNG